MAEDINELRARAEDYLLKNPQSEADNSDRFEVSQLIHELSVYQVELEMQNNQLRQVQEELLTSNISFYKLYNEAPVAYVIIDENNRILKANQTFLNYINTSMGHLINKPLEECFEGENRLQLMAWMRSQRVRLQQIELELTSDQGSRYLQLTSADIDSWNDQPCTFLIFTDTTELVEARRQSALSAAAINASSEGCFVVDNNQRIVFVNPALEAMFGLKQDELIGQHPRILRTQGEEEHFTKSIWQAVAKGNSWQDEVWFRDNANREFACLLRVSPMQAQLQNEYNYVAIVSDITERKKFQDTIIQQATLDSLTGLPNRTLLVDRLKQAVTKAQRNETCVAVMFLDLDGFKDINDTRGHTIGDEFLIQVANRLKQGVRESDTLARMGGDEFIFVLTDMHPDDVANTSQKILDRLAQPFQLEGQEHSISASLGVALFPYHSTDTDELLRLADHAMYEAKHQGKARFAIAEKATQDNH